jgi:hypothetical protein
MVPTIAKLTLLAAILASPAASGIGIPVTDPLLSPLDAGLGGVPAPAQLVDDLVREFDAPTPGDAADAAADAAHDAWVSATDAAGEAQARLNAVLPCQQAVEVTRTWYSAHMTDARQGDDAWRETDWFPVVRTREVAVTVPGTQAREAVPGLLGGVLDSAPVGAPSAQGTTVYRTETYTVNTAVPVAVHVAWRQELRHWVAHPETFVVGLPVAAPFLMDGSGRVTQVCDPATPILSHAPAQSAPGAVAYCTLLCPQHTLQDTWVTKWIDVEAHLAMPADDATPWRGDRYCMEWRWVCDEVLAHLAGFRPTWDDVLAQQAARDAADRQAEGGVSPEGAATVGAGLPAQGIAALLAAGAVGVAGLASYAAKRRK